MIKKYLTRLSLGAVLLLVATPLIGLAADITTKNLGGEVTTQVINYDESSSISLSIEDIKTNKTVYKAGEEIKGSFVIKNHSGFKVDNLSYRIQIGSDYEVYKNGSKTAGSILDAGDRTGSVSLVRDGSIKIDFSYTIPVFISGKKVAVNIVVQSDAGNLVGIKDGNFLEIVGGGKSISLKNAFLSLSNKQTFDLLDGPTIYEDRSPSSASLNLSLVNSGKSGVEIKPELFVYEQKDVNNKLSSVQPSVTVKAGESKDLIITLPTMSYVPGIYFGELILKDKVGQQIASRVGFRYIVSGSVATIQSIQVDKGNVFKGDTFTVASLITGSPFDISSIDSGEISTEGDEQEGQVNIEVLNEYGDVVAEVGQPFNLSGETKINQKLIAQNSASSLRVKIRVLDDKGTLLSEKVYDAAGDYEKIATESKIENKSSSFSVTQMVAGAIIALLIIALLLLAFNKRKPSGIAMLLILILLPLSLPASKASARGCAPASVSVSILEPYKDQQFYPGEQYNVNTSVTYSACNNNPTTVRLKITDAKGQITDMPRAFTRARMGGSAWAYGLKGNKTVGPFTAPTAPGTYHIYAYAHNQAGLCGIESTANRTIVVLPSSPGCTPGVDCGDDGNLNTTNTSTTTVVDNETNCTPGVDCPEDNLGSVIVKAQLRPSFASSKNNMCPFYWVTGIQTATSTISCKLISNGVESLLPTVQQDSINGLPVTVGEHTLVCVRGGVATTTEYSTVVCHDNPQIREI